MALTGDMVKTTRSLNTPHEDQIIDEKAWILLVWTTQSTNFLLNIYTKLINKVVLHNNKSGQNTFV